jgi:GntR family transcriptional repressor for pyruvate dehydrogenase complex
MVQRSSLVEAVVEEIRQSIVSGEYAPGEFLPPQSELAAELDVGRSTVREAIQVLSTLGLTDSRPGKGTWVREDALRRVAHPVLLDSELGDLKTMAMYEARSVIEIGVTELASQRAAAGEVEEIWGALRAMEAALDDDERFVEADLEFHTAVAKASHNVLLYQFYQVSRGLLSETIAELIRPQEAKLASIRTQRAIAEAIEQGDIDAAREAAGEHMALVRRAMLGESLEVA